MNRITFMTELNALLQDIPAEERREAMQFYNDYFDDAGEENEQQVISELESPEKVAEKIKSDLLGRKGEQNNNVPAYRSEYNQENSEQNRPWTSNLLKVILVIAILVVGIPTVIPIMLAILGVVVACVIAVFAVFVALVIAAVALVIAGFAMIVKGMVLILMNPVVSLALIGTGLILGVIGAIGVVAGIKLCIVVFPGIIRGIIYVCRKPFHRKAVA